MNEMMNWRASAAALVLCAAVCVQPGLAAGPSPFRRIDPQIAAASTQVSALEKRARGSDDQCRSAAVPNAVMQACEATLIDNIGACALLPPDLTKSCQELYWRLAHSKILMTGTADPIGAQRLCVATVLAEDPRFPVDVRKFCEIYVRYSGDTDARMAKLAPLFSTQGKPEAPLASVVEKGRMYMGEEESCLPGKGELIERACATARLYRKAYTNKNVGLCGRSGLCRALMGQKENSCSLYETSPAKGACQAKLSEEVAAEQKNIIALLSAMDTMEPRGQPGEASRRRQLSELLKKCSAMMRTLHPSPAGRSRAEGDSGR